MFKWLTHASNIFEHISGVFARANVAFNILSRATGCRKNKIRILRESSDGRVIYFSSFVRRPSKNIRRYTQWARGRRLPVLYFCLRRDVYRYSSKTPSLHSYASTALCSARVGKHLVFKTFRVPPPPHLFSVLFCFLNRCNSVAATNAIYALTEF